MREAVGADVAPAADCFRYYAGWVRKIYGETIPVDGPFFNYTLREPVGVVGGDRAMEFSSADRGVEDCAGAGVRLLGGAEAFRADAAQCAETRRDRTRGRTAGGRAQRGHGYGQTTGEALALHEDVDKISFTGSIATARKLVQNSAVSNLKRLSLELGGKSPNIIFPDADLGAAMKGAFWGIFGGKGEVCSAGSRLLVHDSIYDQFVDDLAARARKLRLGNPQDPATQMGSQISSRQMDRILDYIQQGKQEGAKLVAGGERDTEATSPRDSSSSQPFSPM